MPDIQEKLRRLKEILQGCQGAVLAFSGGVDSTFLAAIAREVLKDKLLLVTASSETYPQHEKKAALEAARLLGTRHQLIFTRELSDERFVANSPQRCYFCKKELFGKLWEIAKELGFSSVLDGANYDDLGDHRPGMRAARELGVKSPLVEAALTKEEIKALSREMGLPTWDKPSMACLASRFPYGERITKEKLLMVSKAEDYLRSLGLDILRVRHHGNLARLEVAPPDFPRIISLAEEIEKELRSIGYIYVALDLKGFRSGSMNEAVEA